MYIKKTIILEKEDLQAIKKVQDIAGELLQLRYQCECDIDDELLENFIDTLFELEHELFDGED